MRVFAILALALALWAIDPVIASAMDRHPELVEFSLSPWLWAAALIFGILLSLLATVAVLGLMLAGVREDAERGE
jgi:hypothetical protein